MPVFAPPYNPRKRYLSALGQVMPMNGRPLGLGAAPPSSFRVDPSIARLLSVPPVSFSAAPRAAAAATTGGRRRRRLSAYDPRRRYLSLGQDGNGDSFDWNAAIAQEQAASIIPAQTTPQYQASLAQAAGTLAPVVPTTIAPPTISSGSYGSVVAPNTAVTYLPSGAMQLSVPSPAAASTASWFNAVNPSLGISNGVLLIGVGLIGAVVLLGSGSSSGRRR
jgi:hypothetical protein